MTSVNIRLWDYSKDKFVEWHYGSVRYIYSEDFKIKKLDPYYKDKNKLKHVYINKGCEHLTVFTIKTRIRGLEFITADWITPLYISLIDDDLVSVIYDRTRQAFDPYFKKKFTYLIQD
jgi:hypothetical protein